MSVRNLWGQTLKIEDRKVRAFYLIKDVPLAAAGLIASEGATHAPQRTCRLTAKGRRALA